MSPLDNIKEAIGFILDFLNPTSDDFILKVAFVPSETYMINWKNEIMNTYQLKFQFIDQFRNTWNSITNTVEKDYWEGITYNNPIIGEVVIVNPIVVNTYADKIKFWIGGCIVLLTIVMTIRRIGGIAGGGHAS